MDDREIMENSGTNNDQDTLNNQTDSGFSHQTQKAISPTPRKRVYSRWSLQLATAISQVSRL
jgi:hypothetical protein